MNTPDTSGKVLKYKIAHHVRIPYWISDSLKSLKRNETKGLYPKKTIFILDCKLFKLVIKIVKY